MSTRSVAVAARAQLTDQSHSHHLGHEHEVGPPEHDRLGLDAAHSPTQHAEAVDHGGVRVGTDHGVRGRPRRGPCPPSRQRHRRRRARPSGVPRARLRPGTPSSPGGRCRFPGASPAGCRTRPEPSAARSSARYCAPSPSPCCERRPQGRRRQSTCREWSMTRSTGTLGSMTAGSPPLAGDGRAQRRQVDHAGHARQVLQQHPAGHEGEFGALGRGGVPIEEGQHVLLFAPLPVRSGGGRSPAARVWSMEVGPRSRPAARASDPRSATRLGPPGRSRVVQESKGPIPTLRAVWSAAGLRGARCTGALGTLAGNVAHRDRTFLRSTPGRRWRPGLPLHGHVVQSPNVGLGRRFQYVDRHRFARETPAV